MVLTNFVIKFHRLAVSEEDRTDYQLQEEGFAEDERTELGRTSLRSAPTGVKRKLMILWRGRSLCATMAASPGELHKGPGQRRRKIRSAVASPLRVLQVIRDKEMFA